MPSILIGFCMVVLIATCIFHLYAYLLNLFLILSILVHWNVGYVLLFYLLEILSPLCLLAQLTVNLIQLTIPILVHWNAFRTRYLGATISNRAISGQDWSITLIERKQCISPPTLYRCARTLHAYFCCIMLKHCKLFCCLPCLLSN